MKDQPRRLPTSPFWERASIAFLTPDLLSARCCLESKALQEGKLQLRCDSEHPLPGAVTHGQGSLVSFCHLVFQRINCQLFMLAQGGRLGGGWTGMSREQPGEIGLVQRELTGLPPGGSIELLVVPAQNPQDSH